LGFHHHQKLAQQVPQSVELIDETEDDRDAVVIDAKLLQVSDQVSPGQIDV
jgi:hypothetical protein